MPPPGERAGPMPRLVRLESSVRAGEKHDQWKIGSSPRKGKRGEEVTF